MRNDEGAPYGRRDPIVNRLAAFFDTFENRWEPSDNAPAICTNGKSADWRWPPRCLAHSERLPVKLKDGHPHEARILV